MQIKVAQVLNQHTHLTSWPFLSDKRYAAQSSVYYHVFLTLDKAVTRRPYNNLWKQGCYVQIESAFKPQAARKRFRQRLDNFKAGNVKLKLCPAVYSEQNWI